MSIVPSPLRSNRPGMVCVCVCVCLCVCVCMCVCVVCVCMCACACVEGGVEYSDYMIVVKFLIALFQASAKPRNGPPIWDNNILQWNLSTRTNGRLVAFLIMVEPLFWTTLGKSRASCSEGCLHLRG